MTALLKTLTKEGQDRKANRLIVEMLVDEHPDIYIALSKKANRKIKRDNSSPLAGIMTNGLDTVHVSSDYIRKQKEISKMRRQKFLEKHNASI